MDCQMDCHFPFSFILTVTSWCYQNTDFPTVDKMTGDVYKLLQLVNILSRMCLSLIEVLTIWTKFRCLLKLLV